MEQHWKRVVWMKQYDGTRQLLKEGTRLPHSHTSYMLDEETAVWEAFSKNISVTAGTAYTQNQREKHGHKRNFAGCITRQRPSRKARRNRVEHLNQ